MYIVKFSSNFKTYLSWSILILQKTCPEEKTSGNGIFEWKINDKNRVDYVISQPDVCWENGSIVLRHCDRETAEWFPNRVQCEKFFNKNIKCPDDLIELLVNDEYVCLKISTKPQTFDEHFYYGSIKWWMGNVFPCLFILCKDSEEYFSMLQTE